MIGDMLGQTTQFWAKGFETREPIHQPVFQAVVDLLDAAGITLGGKLLAAAGQAESFLDQAAIQNRQQILGQMALQGCFQPVAPSVTAIRSLTWAMPKARACQLRHVLGANEHFTLVSY